MEDMSKFKVGGENEGVVSFMKFKVGDKVEVNSMVEVNPMEASFLIKGGVGEVVEVFGDTGDVSWWPYKVRLEEDYPGLPLGVGVFSEDELSIPSSNSKQGEVMEKKYIRGVHRGTRRTTFKLPEDLYYEALEKGSGATTVLYGSGRRSTLSFERMSKSYELFDSEGVKLTDPLALRAMGKMMRNTDESPSQESESSVSHVVEEEVVEVDSIELLKKHMSQVKDPFKVGDVIRWNAYGVYTYAAVKTPVGWFTTEQSYKLYNYRELVDEVLSRDGVSDISIATGESWISLESQGHE